MYQAAYDVNGKFNGVLRLSDGAFVSMDTGNCDWRAFLQWNSSQPSPIDLSSSIIKPPDDPLNGLGLPPRLLAAVLLRLSDSWAPATVLEKQKVMDLINQTGATVLTKMRS